MLRSAFSSAFRPGNFVSASSAGSVRFASSSLKQRLEELIPEKQAEVKRIKAEHGSKVLGEVTVDQAYGGARDVKCLVSETSLLDAQEGIRLRGYTIFDLQEKLPKVSFFHIQMTSSFFFWKNILFILFYCAHVI